MKLETANTCAVWSSAFTRLGRRATGKPPEGGTPNEAIIDAPPGVRAFSLIEVMIAIAIFFMCSFVILALVSSGLRTARMLRTTRPNAGMLAAIESLTNRVDAEGSDSGTFEHMYPDYEWESKWYETGTNGLLQFDYVIKKRGQSVPDSTMSILIYSPGSKSKRLGVQPP